MKTLELNLGSRKLNLICLRYSLLFNIVFVINLIQIFQNVFSPVTPTKRALNLKNLICSLMCHPVESAFRMDVLTASKSAIGKSLLSVEIVKANAAGFSVFNNLSDDFLPLFKLVSFREKHLNSVGFLLRLF